MNKDQRFRWVFLPSLAVLLSSAGALLLYYKPVPGFLLAVCTAALFLTAMQVVVMFIFPSLTRTFLKWFNSLFEANPPSDHPGRWIP